MDTSKPASILIVDDMPNNLGALLDYLTEENFEVLVASDGESAIEQAEYALPDLILLDVLMPGIDGFETCLRLKSNPATKEIPVIFMTALSDTEDKIKGFDVGGVDYIIKPFQQAEVLVRVTTHLSIRNLQKQLQQQNQQLQQEVRTCIQLQSQLEEANRELEAFSYSVAHDLRNPITSINGYIWALEEEYASQLNGDAKYYLQRVRASTERMEELIDALMLLAQVKRSDMTFRRVNLSEIAQEIANSLQQTAPERSVKFQIAPNIFAQGDEALLKVLLENLLGNAWKYTSKNPTAHIEFDILESGKSVESGRLPKEEEEVLEELFFSQNSELKTHSSKLVQTLHVTSLQNSFLKTHSSKLIPQNSELPSPTYYVRDDGVGFDLADADKLFGAFVRLHSRKDFAGSGVGLATVQRIIGRHGGKIWANAAVNQGATFYFTLGRLYCTEMQAAVKAPTC
jgi:two-component system, sensor histidine kinase and response regulator